MTAPTPFAACCRNTPLFGPRGRPEFWWWGLFVLLISAVTALVDGVIFGFGRDASQPVSLVVTLGLILPSIAVGVRRLHDIDRSGWWCLLALIPIIGTLILIYFWIQPGSPGANPHGRRRAIHSRQALRRPTCRQIRITGSSPTATITRLGTAAPSSRSSAASR